MSVRASDELFISLMDDAGVGVAVVDRDLRFRYVNARMAAINGVPAEDHAGRAIADVLPAMSASLEGVVGRVLETGEPVIATMLGGSTDAVQDRHWQASYLPVDTADGPAVGAVVVDVTERVRAAEQAERRRRQQSVAADLGQLALTSRTVEDVLDLVCTRVREALDAERTGLMLLAPEGDLVLRAGAGWPGVLHGAFRLPAVRGSHPGFCLLTGSTVIVRDVDDEQRFAISPEVREAGIRSTIGTPIPGESGPVGVLGAFSERLAHFDAEDADFLRAAAQIVGAALQRDDHHRRLETLATQRGRLVAQAVEAGEREQRRIADVLQDDVLQHLLSARLELSAGDSASLERVRDALTHATELVQGVTASLDPVALAHAGLGTAVRRVAGDHAARGGLEIAAEVDPEAEGVADAVVLSLVRELLTNVVRHAGASTARVRVTREDDAVRVCVADDGRGLPAGAGDGDAHGGLGLAYLRERVEALGGSVTFGPGIDDRGTAVAALVPA